MDSAGHRVKSGRGERGAQAGCGGAGPRSSERSTRSAPTKPASTPPGKPAAGKPAVGKPPAGKPPAGKPPAGKPPAGKPAAGKPAAGKPPAGKPAVGKPRATKAPTSKARTSKPPAGKPPAGQPPAAAAHSGRKRASKADRASTAPAGPGPSRPTSIYSRSPAYALASPSFSLFQRSAYGRSHSTTGYPRSETAYLRSPIRCGRSAADSRRSSCPGFINICVPLSLSPRSPASVGSRSPLSAPPASPASSSHRTPGSHSSSSTLVADATSPLGGSESESVAPECDNFYNPASEGGTVLGSPYTAACHARHVGSGSNYSSAGNSARGVVTTRKTRIRSRAYKMVEIVLSAPVADEYFPWAPVLNMIVIDTIRALNRPKGVAIGDILKHVRETHVMPSRSARVVARVGLARCLREGQVQEANGLLYKLDPNYNHLPLTMHILPEAFLRIADERLKSPRARAARRHSLIRITRSVITILLRQAAEESARKLAAKDRKSSPRHLRIGDDNGVANAHAHANATTKRTVKNNSRTNTKKVKKPSSSANKAVYVKKQRGGLGTSADSAGSAEFPGSRRGPFLPA